MTLIGKTEGYSISDFSSIALTLDAAKLADLATRPK
jgi:hypothetical protein